MRFVLPFVLPLVLLLALPAAAQPEPAPGITAGQEAALVGSAVFTTVGSVLLLVRVSESADLGLGSVVLPLAAVPAVAPATVCALAAAMDLGGSCGRAFRNAFLYALPGYALMSIGLSMRGSDGIGFAFFGALGLLIPPPFAAADGYRRSVAPAAVFDPATGAAAPGLRVAFTF